MSQRTNGDMEENYEDIPTEEAQEGDRQRESVDDREAEERQETVSIEDELEKARCEAKENYDKLLRLAAEFENYKKRMEREKDHALKFAEENIIKELLPTIDNLERAIEEGCKTDDAGPLLEGVLMTKDGLLTNLEKKYGLQPLESIGKPFDPNFHEALSMEASEEVPQNHVLQEFQKGYLLKDKLIRAAKVIVSQGKAEG